MIILSISKPWKIIYVFSQKQLITDLNNLLTNDDRQTQYLLSIIKKYASLFQTLPKETLMKLYE